LAEPDDGDLHALEAKFEAGDYRAVRDGVAKILASADASDATKAAARELRARTEPSRAQIALLVVAALLVLAISAWAVATHGPGTRRSTVTPPRPVEHVR